MTYRQKSPGWEKRRRVWQHNGFFGCVRMMETQLQAMLNAPTVTAYTKVHIESMLVDVTTLRDLLQTRTDQEPPNAEKS